MQVKGTYTLDQFAEIFGFDAPTKSKSFAIDGDDYFFAIVYRKGKNVIVRTLGYSGIGCSAADKKTARFAREVRENREMSLPLLCPNADALAEFRADKNAALAADVLVSKAFDDRRKARANAELVAKYI